MYSYASPVFKFTVATLIVALFGAAGLAIGSADKQAQAPQEIVQLERVVVVGHRHVAAVEHLPTVYVVGHRRHADTLQVAKACDNATASC
ncbi:MAG: hypothetical protein JO224_14030 [Pelomonas sp.]|nr:hypothetical protein [Roseateles sp.]